MLNRSFYNTSDTDFRPELYFRSNPLGVSTFCFIRYAVKFSHEEAAISRIVVCEHIQRVFTSVETFDAQFRFLLHIFFAKLKLEASAFHVLVGSLVDDHLTSLLLSCIVMVVVGSPSLTGAFLFLYSSCWRRMQRSTQLEKFP